MSERVGRNPADESVVKKIAELGIPEVGRRYHERRYDDLDMAVFDGAARDLSAAMPRDSAHWSSTDT